MFKTGIIILRENTKGSNGFNGEIDGGHVNNLFGLLNTFKDQSCVNY